MSAKILNNVVPASVVSIATYNSQSIDVQRNFISGNTAGPLGSILYLEGGLTLSLSDNTITDNTFGRPHDLLKGVGLVDRNHEPWKK